MEEDVIKTINKNNHNENIIYNNSNLENENISNKCKEMNNLSESIEVSEIMNSTENINNNFKKEENLFQNPLNHNNSSSSFSSNKNILIINEELKNAINSINIPILTRIILIIITLNYLLYSFYSYDLYDFSLDEFSIKHKHQYYRFVTSHFIHLNIVHYLVTVVMIIKILAPIEKKIGVVYTLQFLLMNVYLISLSYIAVIRLFKFFISFFAFKIIDYDFLYSLGLCPILLSFYNFENSGYQVQTDFYQHISILKSSKPFYLLIVLSLTNPYLNLISNICGIILSKIIIRFLYFCFCKSYLIITIEDIISPIISKYLIYLGYVPFKGLKIEDNILLKNLNDNLSQNQNGNDEVIRNENNLNNYVDNLNRINIEN